MRAARNIRGFTLIELLVVIGLISILTGMIVTEMQGTREDAVLRATARKLIAALNLAGSQAVAVTVPCTVEIDTARSRFAIVPQEKGTSEEASNGPIEEGDLDSTVTVSVRDQQTSEEERPEANEQPRDKQEGARDGITFYADGTADRKEIVLRDRTGVEMLLRINPVTGRVRIARESEGGP